MDRLVKASGTKAPQVVASKGVKPIRGEGEEAGKNDPHAWQDVRNARLYVMNIRDGLIAADPAGKPCLRSKRRSLSVYPRCARPGGPLGHSRHPGQEPAHRHHPRRARLLRQGVRNADHGAARRATESEASAKDVAKIIRQIKAEKIPAPIKTAYFAPDRDGGARCRFRNGRVHRCRGSRNWRR
jgi:zinc/manganese transport system substrate-binding protein